MPADPPAPPVPDGPRPRRWSDTLPTLLWVGLALAVGVKAAAAPDRHTVWPVLASGSRNFWAGRPVYAECPGLGLSAAARGRWWPAALLLAAPAFVKVWPGLLAALVAAGRPRALAGRLAAAAAGLAAVPFLVAPAGYAAGVYRDWWAALVETG